MGIVRARDDSGNNAPAARRVAGPATATRPPSRRGRSRSACVVNGRLRQAGEGRGRLESELSSVEVVWVGECQALHPWPEHSVYKLQLGKQPFK